MTEAEKILAMSESIGSSSPMMDEEGNMTLSPNTAPVHNRGLRSHKPNVKIDEDFLLKNKENIQKGKEIIDIANKIGSAGLDDTLRYNEDLSEAAYAKNRAIRAINEAISVLGDDVTDYWCPDDATKAAAPKIRDILVRFAGRIQ